MKLPPTKSLAPTILQSWMTQCSTRPDAIAVEFENQNWSYRQLNDTVDRIATWLIQDGLRVGERVGLCVDRSADAIAVMLGVMKSGGVFVPLDPEYPADRIAYMVQDANAARVIGHVQYRDAIGSVLENNADVRWIDASEICSVSNDAPTATVDFPEIDSQSLAYIMYTSGSTGKPKGVEIQHSALAVYCDADIDCYRLTERDRTLQFSTLCFDIAIEEIFPPLLTGGTVVIRPRERSVEQNELSAIINEHGVTAIHLATAYWHQWVDLMVATNAKVPDSLRLVIATGEKVSVEHYHRWNRICQHDVLWCNAYGPTETTVTATVFIPDDKFDSPHMPIGKPLKHYTALILDNELRPVAEGQTGHLFIGGPALAAGYHRREDLTAKAFLEVEIVGDAPSVDSSVGQSRKQRIYRTGDLARWLPDGNIDFAGRVDHQIKLGSYRIEPGEIEAVMNQIPGVLESLVTHDEINTQKYLIAYVATNDLSRKPSDFVEALRESLPPYMVPSRYVMLESFPKTINGKIDRDKLPDPLLATTINETTSANPRNDLERQLASLWAEVLNVSSVGIHDDFFLLGGSSLLVTQVITKLTADFDIVMPVRDFFANPTIATLARHLTETQRRCQPPNVTSQSSRNSISEIDEQRDSDLKELRKRLPIATPHFFDSAGARLYATEYQPILDPLVAETTKSAVVICHPIGHEYTRAYRNIQQLAIKLSAAGHHVLRFDYFGTGNSDGDCHQLTSQTLLQNLVDARHHLISKSEASEIDVIGLRMGALLSASVAADLFDRTILWDPVINGEAMLSLFDRFHQRQLVGFTRFGRDRNSSFIDQSYGHAMSSTKRDSIASLRMRSLTERDFIVASEGALSTPAELDWLSQQPNRIDTSDSIHWDDARYTESAFSSPSSFERITQLLANHHTALKEAN